MSMGDAGMAALAPAMRHLDSLDVAHCGLTSDSAAALALLVQHARKLQTIRLSNNPIGSIGATALAAFLGSSSALRTLELRDCDIGADGAAALGAALTRGWSVANLILDGNHKIGDEGALALAAALDQCDGHCALTELSLNRCNLTATGALALVRAAVRIPSLRYLRCCSFANKDSEKPALVAARGPKPHFELFV
jgi:Ran GTPase-activating protein (RanGAP) involved in mRNA processing and transport